MFIESAPDFLQADKTFFVDRNDRKRKKKISNHNERTTIRFSEAGFSNSYFEISIYDTISSLIFLFTESSIDFVIPLYLAIG